MARREKITFVYRDQVEYRVVAAGEELRGAMERYVDAVAEDASRTAPRAKGVGHAKGTHAADNIVGVVDRVPEGWRGRIGWRRPAYYLKFHEKGTQYMPAKPFLRPAAERHRGLR